jgi:hypothetical protein
MSTLPKGSAPPGRRKRRPTSPQGGEVNAYRVAVVGLGKIGLPHKVGR